MPGFSFIHAADLHLDSPMLGLTEYEGAPVERLRGATRRAFENLVDLAIGEQAGFVLLAGDLYDGDWRDYNTGLFFARRMTQLREAGIPVFAISGNHDAANVMTRQLTLPDNVTHFAADAPQTHTLDAIGAAIHGQSFAARAVTANLAASYPAPQPGYVNIGLLHTAATGREGHEPYAPCTLDDLRSRGYDYWALGHIHARETLCEDPPVEFPGNTQGRHIRETGPKGCLHVRVSERGAMQREFVPLDGVRWGVCRLREEEGGLPGLIEAFREDLAERLEAAEGRVLALRAVVEGSRAQGGTDPELLTNELRAALSDAAPGQAWLEKVVRETTERPAPPPNASALAEIEAIFSELEAAEEPPELLQADIQALAKELPAALRQSGHDFDPKSSAVWRTALEEGRSLLFDALAGGGRGAG